MAIAIKIIYTARDNKGKLATTEVKVPTGYSIAQYVEFVGAMAQLIDAIVDGKITSANFCIGVELSGLGLKALALDASDVEEKGFFQYATAGGYQTRLQIPTFKEGLVVLGSDAIDTLQADVLAFNTAMLVGILVTGPDTIQPSDEREDDIQSLDFAREHFRASGKRA